jgi:hypothetical protein
MLADNLVDNCCYGRQRGRGGVEQERAERAQPHAWMCYITKNEKELNYNVVGQETATVKRPYSDPKRIYFAKYKGR